MCMCAPVEGFVYLLDVQSFGPGAAPFCSPAVRDWEHTPKHLHAAALEVLLQTHLMVGFPRVINALQVVREHPSLAPDPGNASLSCQEQQHSWRGAGEALLQRIYGGASKAGRLRQNMRHLHPHLELWMVEHGYGRVLSRSPYQGLCGRLRELCVVASLAGQNVPPQLISHLLGAVRLGATLQQCREVLDQTYLVWGDVAQQQCDAVWAHMQERGMFQSLLNPDTQAERKGDKG